MTRRLVDPFRTTQDSMGYFGWTAKTGVKVYSVMPPIDRWEDRPSLHAFWSYWQWTKKVLASYGYGGWPVRRHFKRPELYPGWRFVLEDEAGFGWLMNEALDMDGSLDLTCGTLKKEAGR